MDRWGVSVVFVAVAAGAFAKNGIHIHENLNTAALAADGVWTFCYIMLPLLIKGATGSPGRPIALV